MVFVNRAIEVHHSVIGSIRPTQDDLVDFKAIHFSPRFTREESCLRLEKRTYLLLEGVIFLDDVMGML